MKSAWAGLAILLLFPAGSIYGQQQDDSTSVVDAARRTREQKKEQAKAAKVWDNDTIPKKPGEVSVIGQTSASANADGSATKDSTGDATAAPAAPADSAANTANTPSEAAPAAGEKSDRDKLAGEVSAIQADLTAAKSQLQTLKADLDIAQRKFNLDSRTYYSKPNYVADKDGAASIAAEKADLESKQQAVADAQMKVDQIEAKLAAIR